MPLRFINPNFHVILIHYPLGVFVLGVFIELFGFLWSRSGVRTAARWMIAIGALLSIPAATSGIYALWDVRKHQGGLTDASYEMLRWHVIYMGSASILAVLCALIGVGASDVWRKRLHLPLLLGVVVSWGLMVAGAWHGGETIYQNGTSVAIIHVQKHEDDSGKVTRVAKQVKLATPEETPNLKKYDDVVGYYMGGDLQQHLIVAGFAFAVAIGALALAIRRTHSNSVGREIIVERAAAVRPKRSGTNDLSVIQSFNPDAELGATDQPRIPSGRFWLLAALAFIATAALGYWVMTGQDFFRKDGWETFVDTLKGGLKDNRYLAHVILGGAMLVIALICAILAAAAPRNSVILGFFALLLILAIAAQIWIGILLTFDKEGPLTRFKTEEDKRAGDKAPLVQPAPTGSTPATAQ